ncbi:radical SAM protein [Clostridiaceae bacterium M8S5]|nr:radical SAM protein [Clostridiaceae bacterium M8S5]
MENGFNLMLHKEEYVKNKEIDEIHVLPIGALIYKADTEMANRLMEYNMFRVDSCYRDMILDALKGVKVQELIEKYGYEYVKIKLTHAYFSKLIEFTPDKNDIGKEFELTGSNKFFYPPHLAIELTDVCNLACKHCYREAGYSGKFIDFESLKTTILQLKDKGLKLVEVTGGEPTLHPQFNEIVQFLCDNLSLVAILTNGTNITGEMMKVFKKNKNKLMFNISLDSSSPVFHDKFRGKKGAWETTVNALKDISAIPAMTRIAMSVTPENMFDIENTIKVAQENGAKSVAWEVSNTNGRGSSISWGRVSKNNYNNFVRQSKALQIKYHEMITFIPPKCTRLMQQGRDNCGAGWRTYALDPYGNLRACVNANNAMFNLGNVFSEGSDVFESEIMLELAKVGVPRYQTCKNCKTFSYCQGCFIKGIDGALNNENCSWEGKKLLKFIDIEKYKAIDVQNCIMQRSLRQ